MGRKGGRRNTRYGGTRRGWWCVVWCVVVVVHGGAWRGGVRMYMAVARGFVAGGGRLWTGLWRITTCRQAAGKGQSSTFIISIPKKGIAFVPLIGHQRHYLISEADVYTRQT
jgi:hypothetical protein